MTTDGRSINSRPASGSRSAAGNPDPALVETWIFDLDNTLYPGTASISPQISARMTDFVAEVLKLDPVEAERVRKALFREHGTTLRGLMTVHGIDGYEFLDYVHEINSSGLAPAVALGTAIAALPGRKLVHTNASTRHAARILDRLGLAGHFEGVFDIVDAEFLPKPDESGYDALIRRYGFRPERAAMVEDIAHNLRPAAARGMVTLWVRTENDWAVDGAAEPWVHHQTDDLAGWLAQWGTAWPAVDRADGAADRAAATGFDGKTK